VNIFVYFMCCFGVTNNIDVEYHSVSSICGLHTSYLAAAGISWQARAPEVTWRRAFPVGCWGEFPVGWREPERQSLQPPSLRGPARAASLDSLMERCRSNCPRVIFCNRKQFRSATCVSICLPVASAELVSHPGSSPSFPRIYSIPSEI